MKPRFLQRATILSIVFSVLFIELLPCVNDFFTKKDPRETIYNSYNPNKFNAKLIKHLSPKDFICLAKLGEGSFGIVYLVEKINTKEKYAMKVLNKEKIIDRNIIRYAITERNILSNINHPFLVKLKYAFQTSYNLFLITEYCPNGDLSKHLIKEKRFIDYSKNNTPGPGKYNIPSLTNKTGIIFNSKYISFPGKSFLGIKNIRLIKRKKDFSPGPGEYNFFSIFEGYSNSNKK